MKPEEAALTGLCDPVLTGPAEAVAYWPKIERIGLLRVCVCVCMCVCVCVCVFCLHYLFT